MEPKQIFIDGRAGTTGLRIAERLAARTDVRLLTLPEQSRKDPAARREALNAADIAFLCLPDAAAIEAASMVENPDTVIIDASTAHRTAPGWVYGLPELSPGQEAAVASARRIAVPGCHASGFVALVQPLIRAGVLPDDALLTCHSLTGYSGGGKQNWQADQGGSAQYTNGPPGAKRPGGPVIFCLWLIVWSTGKAEIQTVKNSCKKKGKHN